MHGFVSNYATRLDAKGRFSVPAPFRAVLARDGFEGLYCFPSPHGPIIDAGGNQLLGAIGKLLSQYEELTAEHDHLSLALYGASEVLRIDAEGRVMLSETLKEHAGITDELSVVGVGSKFQIWQRARYEAAKADAQARSREAMAGKARAGAA